MATPNPDELLIQQFETKASKEVLALINQAKKERRAIRSRLTKACNMLNGTLANASASVIAIQDGIRQLEQAVTDCEEKDAVVHTHIESQTVCDADTNLAMPWYNPAHHTIIKAKNRIQDMTPSTASTASATSTAAVATTATTTVKARLPKLELPKFKGESPIEYQDFKSQFDSMVHNNTELDSVYKLQLLKNSCEGEAKQIAEGFPVTAANYQELYKVLDDMYGKPRLILQAHANKIIHLGDLKISNIGPFTSSLETALRCMMEFKVDAEDLSPLLVPLIETKMPHAILIKWRETIDEDNDFSTTKLISFLHERARVVVAKEPQKEPAAPRKDGQKDVRPKTTSLLTTGSNAPRRCEFHESKGHGTDSCGALEKMEPDKRRAFIYERKLCFRCLQPGHISAKCDAPSQCMRCSSLHPTIMHGEKQGQPGPAQNQPKQRQSGSAQNQPQSKQRQYEPAQKQNQEYTPETKPQAPVMSTGTAYSVARSQWAQGTLFRAFRATAVGARNMAITAVMDEGSQSTWIEKETADRLGLKPVGYCTFRCAVAFTGTLEPPRRFPIVKIKLIQANGSLFVMRAIVRDGPLCKPLDRLECDPNKFYKHLKNVKFASPYPWGKVNLLIGGDNVEFLKTGRRVVGQRHQPSAVETVFGFVLGGPCNKINAKASACNQIGCIPFEGIEDELKKFYEAEGLGPRSRESPVMEEENTFREEVRQKMRYDPQSQQYTVEIPYKPSIKQLGENKGVAKALEAKQMRRLNANPTHMDQVKQVFEDQIAKGMIEEVIPEMENQSSQKHYMPWHSVLRPGHATTPIRNVMNASQKDSNGLSLNACQEAGPNLIPDLLGLLLQFRSNPVAFIADVSKMFLNIKIAETQRDLHRFFAFGKVLRQTALMFGEASSPYLAIETVHKHTQGREREFQRAIQVILNQLYVDDTITGTQNDSEAIATLQELCRFFESMHLGLQKINSNSKAVLQAMDASLLENKEVTTVLGTTWDTVEDTLRTQPRTRTALAGTKRELLSLLAGLFDPLGIEAPLICKGKLLMQQLWGLKLGWDEPIPASLRPQVDLWLEAMGAAVPKIARHWGRVREIHIFCDASEEAYAAVAYAVGDKATLIMVKTRVKSLKKTTIPRLELAGAVLAAEMHEYTQRYIGPHRTFFWTDSTIVLSWIKEHASQYKVFVGNRIKIVQEKTKQENWRWVPGTENPADIPSRGIWPLNEKQGQLWLNGPKFLWTGEYPEQPALKKEQCEMKKTATNAVAVVTHEPIIDIGRFSNLDRLLNATAYVFRFARKTGGSEEPDAAEREKALTTLIKIDQKQFFATEIMDLQEKGAVAKKSPLAPLNPMMDGDGIIRMNGRVQTEASLIILHPKSDLTKLLISKEHKNNIHSGVSHTLNEMRRRYWLIKGWSTVKSILKGCVVCKKTNSRLAQQQMAPLPEWRTTPSPPFTHVGVDYAGPLFVTKMGTQKRYVLLFTCGVTRAVHLELTQTLEKEDFLLAFAAFTARRGVPSCLYSDNGTTFVAAAKMLPQIKWNFITPLSPWHGGHWERIVRSIKTPLRKVAGGARLKEVELRTLLTKIEGVINTRPLTTLSSDEEVRLITPAELISGRPLGQIALPDGGCETLLALNPSKRMQHLEKTKKQFWNQWHRLYLPTLQRRGKWQTNCPNIREGDIVLLLKENAKRHTWPLAKVVETFQGRDGLVRSVKLLCDGKEIIRPIQLVVPLEVQDQNDHNGSSD